MSKETSRIYPAAPLEEVIVNNGNGNNNEQSQKLLPPHVAPVAPPSYDQATNVQSPISTVTGQHSVIVINNPPAIQFGPGPVDMQCPYCHNFIRTRLRSKPTSQTHLIALILCILQLWCCICLPYCIASCMQTNHYCGICDHYLGTYKKA